MKKITFLIVAFMLSYLSCYAQSASTYSFATSTGTYTENSASATLLPLVKADTYISPAQNIGFTFVYEGVSYTQFKMSSNGFISLNMTGTNAVTGNDFAGLAATTRPVIAPLWDDLDGRTTGDLSVASYELTGTAPNRVLTVEWRNWEWNYSSTTPVISFQAKLYETTNIVEFIYRQEATAVAGASPGASIGIGSATGSGAGSFLSLSSVDTPAVSSVTSTNNLTTKPATGQIYTFTPPSACSGTPIAGTVSPTLQNLCSGVIPANLVASGYTAATGLSFQWQESNDDGVADAWADVTSGTGATTVSYTPVVYSGTPIYYRFKVTCTASGMSSESASVLVSSPAAPANQVTAVTIPAATVYSTQAVVNWTNGNGGRRVAYINNSATFTDPVNGNGPALTANNVYSGSGQQLIYDGTAATVSVSGLTAGTQYYIKVYEYIRCGSGPYDYYYNTTTGTNAGNFTTCGATSVLPWTENFDSLAGVGLTSFPSCWFKENGDWATSNATTRNTPNSGANYLRDSYTATNEYIWTLGFDLVGGTSYDFSTFVQGDGGTGWVVDFFVNSIQNSSGATQIGASYNVPGTGTLAIQSYNQVTRSFTPSVDGIYYFGVRVNQPSGTPWYVAFDDFELKLSPTIPPSCATNLVATPNACGNFANSLTWDAAPTANGYYVSVGTTSGGTDIANNVNVGTTSYSFSGNINTQYFWSVVPFNGAGPATGCVEQSFTTSSTGCYCTSNPTSNNLQGITNVQIQGTDFSTGDVNYYDHTATVVDMVQGINNSVQVSFATGATYDTNIWIDFNDNYTFEASEQVYDGESLATNPTTLDASFIMPATATIGQHMMRIGTANTGQATPNPCYSGTLGVTLDFAVNIVAAACVPPAFTATVAPDCGNGIYFVDVDVTDLGDGTPYISDGTDIWPIAAAGITQVGPFLTGATTVTLTVYHGVDGLCDVPAGSYSYICPPANDECSGAIALTVNADFNCATVTSGTVYGSTASSVSTTACSGTEDDDVWFSFVATATSHRISLLNVVGNTTDMYHSLWTGTDCGSLTSTGLCSDADTSNPTGLTIGQTYYVRVYTWGSTAGRNTTFDICIGTPPPPPANDECSGAIALTVNTDYTCAIVTQGSTTGATASSASATACGGTEDDDVWYSFVATATTHRISLSNVTGSVTDMYHSLWSGADCASLSLVAGTCSDNNTSNPSGLVIGQTYYLRIYTLTATGNQNTQFDICITLPSPPPANDTCVGAVALTPGGVFGDFDVVGSTLDASTVAGLTYACQTNRANEVWYSVVVPASGSITIETQADGASALTDTVLSVFSGTCGGTLTEVGCSDDEGTGNFSIVNITGQTPGSTLYIGVWRWSSATDGSFLVSAYDASLGTGSFDSTAFKAYPNPVVDVLNLSYSTEISSVEVYNMLGQVVLTKKMNATDAQIDMSNLKSGSYIVKVTSDGLTKTLKVVKN